MEGMISGGMKIEGESYVTCLQTKENVGEMEMK